jgi:tetratricopeptide (TPR) repeat protein
MDRKLLWRQANTLKDQGHKARDTKDWEHAQTAYKAALNLYTQINVRSLQGQMLQELARIARTKEQLSDAHDYYKQAIALRVASGSLNRDFIYGLANVYFLQGHQEAACALIPEMWAGVEKQTRRDGIVWGLSLIGQFAEKIGANNLANESYRKALHYDTLLNRGRGQNVGVLYHLGCVTRKQGQYVISQGFHAQAMHVCEQSRSSIMKPSIFHSWALLEQAAGHIQEACHLIRLACLEEKRHEDESSYNETMRPDMLDDYAALTGSSFA